MDKSNAEVADFFRRIADLLELKGDNPFKTRSYRTASETLGEMGRGVADMVRSGGAAELQAIPGVGKSISAQTVEFVETGTSSFFEQLRQEIPETVADLLRVRGIGMKTALTLYRDFGVLGLDDLKQFAEGGGLEVVPGLAERSAGRLLSSVDELLAARPRLPLARAADAAGALAGGLAAAATSAKVIPVGEIRRRRPEVAAVELLAVSDDGAALTSAFVRLPEAKEAVVLTPERAEITTTQGLRAVLYVAGRARQWPALVRTTGSRRHVRELEERAAARSLEFRGYALLEQGSGAKRTAVEVDSEEDFYAQLGLRPIPPELREGSGEIEEALGGP